MKHNDTQLGIPETIYKGTKADIEAAYTTPGMVAYATDTELYGYRDTSAWVWGTGALSFGANIQPVTSASAAGTSASAARSDHAHLGDHGGLGGLADNDHPQYLLQALATTTSHYTGFPNRTDTALSWVDGVSGATRTLTLGGTNFDVYIDGLKYTIASDMTKQIADVTGLYWFWIELVTGVPTLQGQVGAPGFGKCLVATVYWNTTTDKGILSDERHWMGRDKWMHEYLHETVGARYYEGLTGTFGNTTFSVTAGEFYDEDIEHVLSADSPMAYPGTAITTCKVLYHNGDANWAWDAASTTPYKITTGDLRYNSGNTLATAGNDKFINYWIFATAGVDEPIWVVVGTAQYNKLADARAASVPPLGALPSAEIKLIYRVTYKNDGTPTYQEAADYRASQVLGSTFVPTNHAVLSNLSFATSGHTGFQAEITAQAANAFLIGPASGADAVPTFRAVVNADIATSGSAGSLLYQGATAPAWSAVADLVWDAVNKRLGIKTAAPRADLDINGASLNYAYIGYVGIGSAMNSSYSSPRNYANFGCDHSADLILGLNTYLKDHLFYVANSHATISGTMIVFPSNGTTTRQSSIEFWTTPKAAVTANDAYARSSPRMIIAGDGKVGIGTIAPGAALDIKGDGTNPAFKAQNSAGSDVLTVDKDGVLQAAGYKSSDGTSGWTGTVALAKLTSGGADGSLTIKNGLVTAYTAPS